MLTDTVKLATIVGIEYGSGEPYFVERCVMTSPSKTVIGNRNNFIGGRHSTSCETGVYPRLRELTLLT